MDPTNNNPTPSPLPGTGLGSNQPNPTTNTSPVAGGPNLQPISQNPLVSPSESQPVPPVAAAPVSPATPASSTTPMGPSAPVSPASPIPPVPQGSPSSPVPPIATPVNPIINPGVSLPQNGVGATDAILRPEPVAPPDPVEEELKAPMRAAAPAPGSIGSAVSGPADEIGSATNRTPSVSFNDPATQPDANSVSTPLMSKGAKKSNNKTLIALIVVAALVVLGLGVVLAMQFMTGQPAPSSGSQSNNSVVEPDNNSSNTPGPADSSKNSDSSEASNSTTSVNKVLTCTKTASSESSEASPSTSSVTTITANFKDGKLVDITSEAKATTVTSDSESSAKTVTVADITTANAAEYNLPVKEGIVDFTLEGIRSNYELLDFTCEAL